MTDDTVWAQDDFFDETDELGTDQTVYRAEIGFFDRAGPEVDPLIRRRFDGQPLSRADRAAQEPLERFVTVLNARSRELGRHPGVRIDQTQITEMLNHARHVPRVGYKNVTAYILGYLASRGGKRLDEQTFQETMSLVYPHIDDKTAVTQPDVLR